MALYLDHAFIICSVGAPEAEALLTRGFVEGSANVHPGQGTANRRFFFPNFMLELLWVADPAEAASEAVRPTGLWERWSRRTAGANPFGIVYGGAPAQDSPPPFVTKSYCPAYLPPQMSIEIVQDIALDEPALFWMRSLNVDRFKQNEPTNHSAPVRPISGIAIGMPGLGALSLAARRIRAAGLLDCFETPSPVLEVYFWAQDAHSIDCRPQLPLVFRAAAR